MNTSSTIAFSDLPIWTDPDWKATRAQVKKLLGGTNLKRAVDTHSIEGYVRSLLWPWPKKSMRQIVDEVRAYRRDHRFYECV